MDMKEIITEAARKLVLEKKVKKLTVKDIVEECQITRQAFYYHFEGIPDMIQWSIKQGTRRLLEACKEQGGAEAALKYLFVFAINAIPEVRKGIESNHMHSEFYIVEEDQAKLINDTKKNGGRVIAVGTTSCRTLESATGEDGVLKSGSGWTEIFIYPGYKFKMIDGLITNFHLPESTLVMLVSALAGKENILHAYEVAVQEKYRFFSFGDAMLIL